MVAMLRFAEHGMGILRHPVDGIGACLVEGYWIEGGEYPDIRHDWGIVLPMAVAVGRDVYGYRDVERRPVLKHRLRILHHPAVEYLVGVAGTFHDGILGAYADASAAPDAPVVVYHAASGIEGRRSMRADFLAAAA